MSRKQLSSRKTASNKAYWTIKTAPLQGWKILGDFRKFCGKLCGKLPGNHGESLALSQTQASFTQYCARSQPLSRLTFPVLPRQTRFTKREFVIFFAWEIRFLWKICGKPRRGMSSKGFWPGNAFWSWRGSNQSGFQSKQA